MVAPATRKAVLILSAFSVLSAAGSALWFSDLAPISRGSTESLLSMLRDRSPGQRAPGAQSVKQPMSAMLSERTPAAKLRPAMAPAAPPAKFLAPTAGSAPLPLVAAPMPFAPPPVAIPAFAPAGVAGPLFIPPILIPGGGGDVTNVVVNPPGAGPSPVPGVPEPESWVMLIIGFGLTGAALRRRRRLTKAWASQMQRSLALGSLPVARTGAP
jgi:hypothetical protein